MGNAFFQCIQRIAFVISMKISVVHRKSFAISLKQEHLEQNKLWIFDSTHSFRPSMIFVSIWEHLICLSIIKNVLRLLMQETGYTV